MGINDAFKSFGIVPKNSRRPGWSGVAPDGRVVVTLWAHQFKDAERRVFDTLDASASGPWVKRFENKARIQHLKLAQAKRDGLFESLIIHSKDGMGFRRIESVERGPTMKLERLDETTGRFRAVIAFTR